MARTGRPRPASPAALCEDAERVRAAFIAAVRAHHDRRPGNPPSRWKPGPYWDGGYHPATGANRKPVWPGLVERARGEGLDPVELVRLLFANWPDDQAPTPYMVTAGANLERARRVAGERRRAIAHQLRGDEATFRSAVFAASCQAAGRDQAVAFALNDLGRPVSALFRYLTARAAGLSEVAERWKTAAARQLAADPAGYREYWAAALAPDVAAELLEAA